MNVTIDVVQSNVILGTTSVVPDTAGTLIDYPVVITFVVPKKTSNFPNASCEFTILVKVDKVALHYVAKAFFLGILEFLLSLLQRLL